MTTLGKKSSSGADAHAGSAKLQILATQRGYLIARAPGWEDRRTRKVPVGCTTSSASAVSRVTANPQMACGSVASHILPTCNHDAMSFCHPTPEQTSSMPYRHVNTANSVVASVPPHICSQSSACRPHEYARDLAACVLTVVWVGVLTWRRTLRAFRNQFLKYSHFTGSTGKASALLPGAPGYTPASCNSACMIITGQQEPRSTSITSFGSSQLSWSRWALHNFSQYLVPFKVTF